MGQFKQFVGNPKSRYKDFVEDLSEAVAKHDADMLTLGMVDGFDVYKITINPKAKKSLCVIAGIHGDEPGGPLGVLQWLRGEIPENVAITVFPAVNAFGFANNVRRDARNRDLNRRFCDPKLENEDALVYHAIQDKKFDLVITLHELTNYTTKTRKGFFLYYSNEKQKPLYRKLVNLAGKYFQVDRGRSSEGDPMSGSLVPHKSLKRDKHECSLETFLYKKGSHYITPEAPGDVSLHKRTRFFADVLDFALKNLVH